MKTTYFPYRVLRIITIFSIFILAFISFSCTSGSNTINDQNTALVKRGDIESHIEIRGKLEMPHESKLHFKTAGTVQELYVVYGSKVNAGTLLAKLDDASQKQAVEQAQYNVQIALNELAEKVYSSIMGYPYHYPPVGILLRFEAAQEEIDRSLELLKSDNYREAMTQLRLAIHDLHASLELLQPPVEINYQDYPGIPAAMAALATNIDLLEQDTEKRLSAQTMINKGLYNDASIRLATVSDNLIETHRVINGITGIIRSYFPLYPDTSTSLDISKQVKDSLKQVQTLLEEENRDAVETAEKLSIAIHDLEISNDILENSELIFKHGLNLKLLRLNNLNLEKAEKALESAKTELMKTEIIAPFDGIVVDVPVKAGDVISAVDYNARTIVQLVDTSGIELTGYVDEKEVRHINLDQNADILVDVIPGTKFGGKVAFVSPYGAVQSGVSSFFIQIVLDPSDTALQRGLSATAVIPLGKHDDVFIIPASAVRFSNGEYWTAVVTNKDTGEIEKRTITPGLQNDDFVEVVSGLQENEMVTLQGLNW